MNLILMISMVTAPCMGLAFTPTALEGGMLLANGLAQVAGSQMHNKAIEGMDANIDFCLAHNAHIFTAETRQFIQSCVEKSGITAHVVAVSGFLGDPEAESLMFQVMHGKNDVFYLNIPWSWVYFLNDTLKKQAIDEPLSEKEIEKINMVRFLIAHEMNHVKKMIAGTSTVFRAHPWKKVAAKNAIGVSLVMYLARAQNVSYMQQFPVLFSALYASLFYKTKSVCDEEYACDHEGIADGELLRAGATWLRTDVLKYIDGFFAKRSTIVQTLYKKYPNLMCSFYTNHPHPIVRAEEIENKIAKLEADSANTQEVAIPQ